MTKLASLPALCGIIAPPLMVVLLTVASVLRPGYNQLTQKGSELGTGPNSIVMNLNFAITGVLIIIFAFGLLSDIGGTGKLFDLGMLFLMISGIGGAVVAAFPCDPGCPAMIGSFSQNVHLGIAISFFPSLAIAPLFIGMSLNSNPFWKPHRRYSIASGLAGAGLFVIFADSILASFQYVGLIERLLLAVPFLWIELTAVHLLRHSREKRR